MPRPGTHVIHPAMLSIIRTVAEAAMVGEGQLYRPNAGAGSLNDTTLVLTPPAPTLLWSGPCRYQPKSDTTVRVAEAGGRNVTTARNQLTLPWEAPEARVDDRWVMTASPDPTLVGKTFRVIQVAFGDLQAERNLTVEDYETPRRI